MKIHKYRVAQKSRTILNQDKFLQLINFSIIFQNFSNKTLKIGYEKFLHLAANQNSAIQQLEKE